MTKNVEPHKPPGEPSKPKGEALLSKPYVLHRQKAITTETGEMFDVEKKRRTKKGKTVDALAREDTLSLDSRKVLQGFVRNFVKSCFSRGFQFIIHRKPARLAQLVLFSIPIITAEGYQIRTSEDYRKGQPASSLHYKMVPGVLP